MAAGNVDLAIRLTADADDAERAFSDLGAAALDMGADVERGTRDADAAASRLDGAAEAADGMASSSSQAAGGLGDLGGALSLMPGPLGALGTGMEAVAPAIMGVTGAADLANLALESNVVQTVRARASAIAHGIATKAQAVALGVATTAQKAFNLAMRANPIGLVITGVLLLVGLFVLLYKRSDRFRAIVDRVMAVARVAIDKVVDVLTVVGGWVKDKLPKYFAFLVKVATIQWRLLYYVVKVVADKVVAALAWLRDKAVAVWEWIKDKGTAAWDFYVDKVRRVIDVVRGIIDRVKDTVGSVAEKVRSVLGGAFDWVADKVQDLIDKVQGIVDKIGSIHLPDIPGLRVAVDGTAAGTAVAGTGDTVNIVLPPVSSLDPAGVQRLVTTLDNYYASRGQRVRLVPR